MFDVEACLERTAEQTTRTTPERDELTRLLAERLDLPGCTPSDEGRLVC